MSSSGCAPRRPGSRCRTSRATATRRDDVAALLEIYRDIGIENILALAGDPRADGQPEASDYRYAIELLEDVVSAGCFASAVAAHPQVHPRSPDRASDRRHLADKLRVADFAMTQFFFEVEEYTRLIDELAALGVDKPVLPGIMPISNVNQVKRMADMSGAALPGWLADRLDATDDPGEIRKIGVEVASTLCAQLIEFGAPGLHLYALNRPEAVLEICANLNLAAR